MTNLPVYGALDLATKTGVCAGEAFKTPCFQTWILDGGAGRRGVMLRRRVRQWAEAEKVWKVFIEAPMKPHVAVSIGFNSETAYLLNGYIMIAETELYSMQIPVVFVERQDALLHFTGRRSFPKPKGSKKTSAAKIACATRCKQLRWPAENWDESDAAAIWDYGCAQEHSAAFMRRAVERPKLF